jgi:predicted RNA-binding Zn-ribbon protein involved in translation (DUF1610 family)
MAVKIVRGDYWYECPNCGFTWNDPFDLDFNEAECCPCCPNCGELIEDGGDY